MRSAMKRSPVKAKLPDITSTEIRILLRNDLAFVKQHNLMDLTGSMRRGV
jgi:hypothetical protein